MIRVEGGGRVHPLGGNRPTRARARIGVEPAGASTLPTPYTRASSPVALADLITAIVERAQRLRAPTARDPEAFHLDKGELVGALIALERRVREGGP